VSVICPAGYSQPSACGPGGVPGVRIKERHDIKTGRTVLFILAPLLILMLPVAVYAVDQSVHDGTLPRNVSIAGVSVAGLQPQEALTVVRAYQDDLYADPAVFVVNGEAFDLDPANVGLVIDVESAVSQAVAETTHGTVDGLFAWIRSFSSTLDIPVAVTIDGEAIAAYLEQWEIEAIPELAFDGGIAIVDGAVQVDYPKPGLRIDRDAARTIVESTLVSDQRGRVEIPLIDRPPVLSRSDLDEAASTVEKLISRPIILTEGAPRIDVGLDRDAVALILEPTRTDFEQPPVEVQIDASFATNRVTVTPPKNGTLLTPTPSHWPCRKPRSTADVVNSPSWTTSSRRSPQSRSRPGVLSGASRSSRRSTPRAS